jgi:hypothetical protein
MTALRSLKFAAAALILALGTCQALAATTHASTRSAGTTAAAAQKVNLANALPGPTSGITGDNFWLRPDCLQPKVMVETSRGPAWERKPECGG